VNLNEERSVISSGCSTLAVKLIKMRKTLRNIAVVCLLVGLSAPVAIGEYKTNDDTAIVRNLDIFNALYKELNTFYVDTLNSDTTISNAINAMLDQIDPYTEYIPAKDQEDFMVISTGEYGGVGSSIMQRKDSSVVFSEPFENSPAVKAGIKAGDRILMIDSDSVKSWNTAKVSKHLKGQANTKVKVMVQRPYTADSIKTFNIMREQIKVDPVQYYGVTRSNIGYINLNTFNEYSAQEVKDALIALKKNPAVKYIVLDLRSNGGGLLESAVQIVGLFVPKGTQVLQTKGRAKQDVKTYKTTENPIDTDIPLAVLVDGGSASAAEITAGSLQDLDRAVVLGSRSFGKGLVQTTRPLPFDALLKVTVAKYYIPSGRLIQEIDYSRRNADGSFSKMPDSLAHVFKTAHGRDVRDGGGITPDIKVDYPELTRIVYNIVRDNWAFDFATKYASEHESIPAPGEFAVTDTIFNQFKRFINPKKFDYDKVCETGLDKLKKSAETEGYMNDSTKAEFAKLDKLLKHDLSHDLDIHRKEISKILAQEILSRYYYQKGQIEYSLKNDEIIDRAEMMFGTPGKYEQILNLNATTSNNSKKAAAKKSKKKK
jgi:carboxyl-terminal processing protease